MSEDLEPSRAISEHGLIALVMMLRFHGIAIDAERIRHQFGGSIGIPEMLRCAKELGLKDWERDADTRERWIAALATHPKLIQRPIITADDGTAVVARTDEAVRDALSR